MNENVGLIHKKLFEDDGFLALPTAEAQGVFLYLLVHRNVSGLFGVSLPTLYLKTQTKQKDIQVLIDAGFISFCPEHSLVWLRSGLKPRYFKCTTGNWRKLNQELVSVKACHLASEFCDHNSAMWGDRLKNPYTGDPVAAAELTVRQWDLFSGKKEGETGFRVEGRGGREETREGELVTSFPKVGVVGEGRASVPVSIGTYWKKPGGLFDELCSPPLEADDRETLTEVFSQCLTMQDGETPRAEGSQIKFLEWMSKRPPVQVLLAAQRWLEVDVVGTDKYSWPYERVFRGFVRNSEKAYQGWLQREEIRNERKRQKQRKREQRVPLEGSSGERGPSGPVSIGAILRKLPEV